MVSPKRWICPSTAVCCKLHRRLQFRMESLLLWTEAFATICFVFKPGWDLAASSFCTIQAIGEAPLLCLVPDFQKTHDSLKNRSAEELAGCSAKAPSHGLQDRHISSLILWKSTFNCTAIRNQVLFLIFLPLQNGWSLKTAHKNSFLKSFREFSAYQDYFLLFPASNVSVSIHSHL